MGTVGPVGPVGTVGTVGTIETVGPVGPVGPVGTVGSWGLLALSVPHAANFATLDSLSLDDVDPDACWWPHLLDHVMLNSA